MIDPNKTYRTRDGRPVRIYATDGGGPNRVHGAVWDYEYGWLHQTWNIGGKIGISALELVEVTLADELRDQIPWEALRAEIRYVAMDRTGDWWGFSKKPVSETWAWDTETGSSEAFNLEACRTPCPDTTAWRETLIERPEDK